MIKKILSMLLCCMMAMFFLPNQQKIVCAEDLLVDLSSEELALYSVQAESIEQYRQLLTSFNENSKERIVNQQYYDDNYGGAYINEEGKLVVLVVELTSQASNCLRTITENDDLIIKSCQYSFNELIEVIDTINENLEKLLQNNIVIASVYEDVYTNQVRVNVFDLTPEKEREIREIIDSSCMVVSNTEEMIQNNDEKDMAGGNGITNLSTGKASTMGFCASVNGQDGFVISGHTASVGNRFSSAGTYIGTVTDSAYYSYSTVDAAFITKADNTNVTSNIGTFKCHYRATELADYPVGAQIMKLGLGNSLTPYTTTGKILSNYYTSYDGTYYITAQCQASYESTGGDSGGPVFMVKDVVNGQITCKLLGIHKGHYSTYGTDAYYSIFSKLHLIEYELDVQVVMY